MIDLETEKDMTEIITYRLDATGVWGYDFYDGRNRIGSIRSPVLPSPAVQINGKGLNWYSKFSMDHTIVPGSCRWVKDNQTGREVYRMIYWQPGWYQVRMASGNTVQVEIRDGAYLFGAPDSPVTAMTQRISAIDWIPSSGYDIHPYFRTTVYEEVDDAVLLMILSFPALRFY